MSEPDYFPLAWRFTAKAEGGFQDNPDDPGNYDPAGRLIGTAFGVSAKYNPGIDIRALTLETAAPIARGRWNLYNLAYLPPFMAVATFDACYSAGHIGVMALQAVLGVPIDGILGKQTAAAARIVPDQAAALAAVVARLQQLSAAPDWHVMSRGWINRCFSLAQYLRSGMHQSGMTIE